MPVSDEQLRRYKAQIARYRDRTSGILIAAWDDLGSWNEDDVERFETVTAPALVGAKQAAVALSAGFFALVLGIRPVGVRADDVDITPDTRGPFRATWHALNMGRSPAESLIVGRSTAQAVGFDFVQSTARRTGDVVAAASGQTVKWRRVPGSKSCDWCRMVAGQTYQTAASADFGHERDDCDVIPA